MLQITAIKPQKRQKRVNIFLDGKFSFGLDLETLAKTGLKVGQRLSEETIQKIIQEGELTKVYLGALRFLSYRPRSEKELVDWFKRKSVGDKTQEIITKKLKKLGYLADKEFTSWWVEQRTSFRPQGRKLMRFELRRKGIQEALIDEVFQKIKPPFSEQKLAEKAALKKLKSLKGLPRQKVREKLAQFLLRRGFSWESVSQVLKKVI